MIKPEPHYARVWAMQFTHDNAEAVARWNGGNLIALFQRSAIPRYRLAVAYAEPQTLAYEGDWLVKYPNGSFQVVPEEELEGVLLLDDDEDAPVLD